MPYIQEIDRIRWNNTLIDFAKLIDIQCTPGDLNYIITSLCHQYVKYRGENYTHYNDVVGVLECAKQELYRRKISGYEDKKIKLNGDVSQ